MVPPIPPQKPNLDDPFEGLNLDDLLKLPMPKVQTKIKKKSVSTVESSEPSSPRVLSSASDLLPRGKAIMDEICSFSLWRHNVYATYHDATLVEFSRYLWLLNDGRLDCWYKLPSKDTVPESQGRRRRPCPR
jgi:hypothetical protein